MEFLPLILMLGLLFFYKVLMDFRIQPVYFVTVFYIPHKLLDGKYLETLKEKPKGWKSFWYKRTRCWGWFADECDAESCIKENWGDIYEIGYYNFAIIERFGQGPFGVCETIHKTRYFTVDYLENDDYKIKEIGTPELFKNVIGYAYA